MTGPVGGSGRRGVQSVTGRASGGGSEVDAGALAFYELSKRLKAVGGSGKGSLRSEMNRAIRQAAKPLPRAVKDAARRELPGGLGAHVAKRTPKVVTRTGAQTAGVRIEDRKTDPRMSTQGRVPHPVFGRRGKPKGSRGNPNVPGKNFVVTPMPEVKGYFEDAIRDKAPQIRQDLINILEDFAARLLKGL